jgi:hypothetical protein
MYMRVLRSHIDPAKVDELIPLVAEVEAVLKQLPGFQSYTPGIDRAKGQGCSFTVWDTQEHADRDYDELSALRDKLRAIGVERDSMEVFELIKS